MTAETILPSRALDARSWERATNRLVETTRDLIRISSVNPPLAAGAFYCVLDLLVTATCAGHTRRRSAAAPVGAGAGQP